MSWLRWLTHPEPPPASAFDHDAPDLEETLPATVAGRPLVRWSVAGDNFWRAAGGKRVRSALAPELLSVGVEPEDIEMAVAGRQDTKQDPPYIIWALTFGDLKGADLLGSVPSALAMDVMHVQAGKGENWRDAKFAGQKVLIGNREMIKQDRHQRGLPYVWLSKTAIYALIADDEAWAKEVIAGHAARERSRAASG